MQIHFMPNVWQKVKLFKTISLPLILSNIETTCSQIFQVCLHSSAGWRSSPTGASTMLRWNVVQSNSTSPEIIFMAMSRSVHYSCSINLVLMITLIGFLTLRFQVKIPAPMGTERSAGGPESISEAAELLAGAKVATHLYFFHSFTFTPLSVEPCHYLWRWCCHGGRCGCCCPTGGGTEGKSIFYFSDSDKTRELFIRHNTQWQNLFRLQCAPHISTMTLSPAPTTNGWDPLATKGARQQ